MAEIPYVVEQNNLYTLFTWNLSASNDTGQPGEPYGYPNHVFQGVGSVRFEASQNGVDWVSVGTPVTDGISAYDYLAKFSKYVRPVAVDGPCTALLFASRTLAGLIA